MGLSVELHWVAHLFIRRIKGEFSWMYSEIKHSPIRPIVRCIIFVHSVFIDSLSLLEICSSVHLYSLHKDQVIFTKVRIIFAVGRLHGRWTTLPQGKNIIYGCLRLWCRGKYLDRKERCSTAELKAITLVMSASHRILPHFGLCYIAEYFSVFQWPFIFRFLDKTFDSYK
jgi:hypothetical protein